MPSNNQFPEQQPDPWLALHELIQWLTGTLLHCALGLALGIVAARQMRRHHLHWSWAVIALALVVIARSILGGLASTLLVACSLAAARGRRWHRQDLDTGADLGEIAADRFRPRDLLRLTVNAVMTRLPGAGAETDQAAATHLTVGRDRRGSAVAIPFQDGTGGQHTLVVGATGSGKTVTQTLMAVRSIERGMGAIVIDPKGDGGMCDQLERAARRAGRRFVRWTPAGQCVYNPYGYGASTEIADRALAGERFTEPHYLRQAQRYLGHVIRMLRCSEVEVSLKQIVQHLDPSALETLARTVPESDAQTTYAYLDSLTPRQQSDLAGVRDRLATLVESDVGPWLDPGTADAERFDLLGAVRERAVVYFGLESDRRPLLAQMLGAAIVQDLQSTVAELQASPLATIVVIDEFSAVAAEQVVRLFGRARSAGVSLVLGTQEVSDLRLPGAERLLEQVMGNLSVLIAHRQAVPGSAELISSMAGTRGAWKVSRHSDERTTRTRTREAVLDPERVMSLGRGCAAVIELGRPANARIAHVISLHQTPNAKENR
jgi:conjugal transfer pilus assembly protein TraD